MGWRSRFRGQSDRITASAGVSQGLASPLPAVFLQPLSGAPGGVAGPTGKRLASSFPYDADPHDPPASCAPAGASRRRHRDRNRRLRDTEDPHPQLGSELQIGSTPPRSSSTSAAVAATPSPMRAPTAPQPTRGPPSRSTARTSTSAVSVPRSACCTRSVTAGSAGAYMPANVVVGPQAREVALFVSRFAGRQAVNEPAPGIKPCVDQADRDTAALSRVPVRSSGQIDVTVVDASPRQIGRQHAAAAGQRRRR